MTIIIEMEMIIDNADNTENDDEKQLWCKLLKFSPTVACDLDVLERSTKWSLIEYHPLHLSFPVTTETLGPMFWSSALNACLGSNVPCNGSSFVGWLAGQIYQSIGYCLLVSLTLNIWGWHDANFIESCNDTKFVPKFLSVVQFGFSCQ